MKQQTQPAQVGIEDFLSSSQTSESSTSLLDLSLTSQQQLQQQSQLLQQQREEEEEQQQEPVKEEPKQRVEKEEEMSEQQHKADAPSSSVCFNEAEYRGFSAQSSSIPSISCNNTKGRGDGIE